MKNAPVNENFRLRTRPDGILEVAWTNLQTGLVMRKSTGTRDESTARAEMSRIAADARTPKDLVKITVGDLIARYLKAQATTKSPHQLAALTASLRPVTTHLGALRWDQLSQDRIDEYVAWRMKQPAWDGHKTKASNGRTVGPSTANKDLRMLRTVLNDSLARRYIGGEVKFKVNVSASSPRESWLTKAEVRLMLDACAFRESVFDSEGKIVTRRRDREHLFAFITISVASAARKEAVLSLKWDQVHAPRPEDLPKGIKVLDLQTAKVGGNSYIDFGEGRGNKRRPKMPVGQNPALMSYLLWGGDRTQPYVITYKGRPLADIKKGFAELLKDCGIKKKVTPHSLKHTAITWLVQSGMELETISELTSTSVKILRGTYAHHRPDYQKALGDALSL